MTKVLANRLKTGLKEIINTDQIGYMEGRFCGENTRLIADMIEYAKLTKTETILLLIDFEKTFDTINWNFLLQTLEFYNFGPFFINWIKLIYKDIYSRVANNGYISETFGISRGIRQGDPISALLFLPVAEIMATVIRNNTNIKGIVINDIELKLCQLADDTSLFLSDIESVKIALTCFEEFYRYAGLQLNRAKTEAIILHNNGNILIDSSLNIRWHSEPFKTLGIWYSLNTHEMISLNINERMDKIKNILNIWQTRHLSLKGKITVIKSLIMPHIIHLASVLYLDENLIKTIDSMLFNFLWSNRKHGISKNTLIQNIDTGGLKMICIFTMIKSIKIMWFKRLLSNYKAKWKNISWILLNINKTQLFSKLNLNLIPKPKIAYYEQSLAMWYEFVNIQPLNVAEILNENLFHNKDLTIDNLTLSKEFNILRKNDINKIEDIFNLNSKRFLNINQISLKCHKTIDVLLYNKLISAIPSRWKQMLKNDDHKDICKLPLLLFKQNDISQLFNKDVYNILIRRKSLAPSSQEKWVERYPFLEIIDWSQIYRLPYKICRDTKLQSQQFKLLHRYVNCNLNLFKWKIIDSPNCKYCGLTDTIEHFYYECCKSEGFWDNIIIWIKNITNISIKFTILEILFGIMQENDHSKLCNYIILQGKNYIYRCKMEEKEISTMEFLAKLKHCLHIDREIAINTDKLDIFDKTFGDTYDLL